MSSTAQIRLELLEALSLLGQLRPEWRFGQTVANLATTAGRGPRRGLGFRGCEPLVATRALIEQYAEIGNAPAQNGTSTNGCAVNEPQESTADSPK
jgi:hypothetical protein